MNEELRKVATWFTDKKQLGSFFKTHLYAKTS